MKDSYKEVCVLEGYRKREEKRVLVLNRPFLLFYRDFYIHFFRIPEVLTRLEQYRSILRKDDRDVPVWLYCLAENTDSLKGIPKSSVLNFIVNLGLFDRYIAKQGWPAYIIGKDFLISSALRKEAFKEWVLFFTYNDCGSSKKLFLYKTHFALPNTSFSHLELLKEASSFKNIITALEPHQFSYLFQFISPNDKKIQSLLKSTFFTGHFLEQDEDLKWLWPIWKKNEILYRRKSRPSRRVL